MLWAVFSPGSELSKDAASLLLELLLLLVRCLNQLMFAVGVSGASVLDSL